MNQSATPASRDPLLTTLLAQITSHRPDADGQLITRAYQAAAHWHHGQQRKSGDPYLTHPVAVAVILAELGADDHTLGAAATSSSPGPSCTPKARNYSSEAATGPARTTRS